MRCGNRLSNNAVKPPNCGERGGMKFSLVSIVVWKIYSSLLWGSLKNSCRSSISSFWAPTKLVALSDQIIWGFPLRLINLFMAAIKDCVQRNLFFGDLCIFEVRPLCFTAKCTRGIPLMNPSQAYPSIGPA